MKSLKPTVRTFLSLNTDSSLKPRLKIIQEDVKHALKDFRVKWENPDKFHLTLRFLGDINEDKIEELIFVLDRLKFDFDSLKFTSGGVGFFPNPKYPNVVFIDLAESGNDSVKLVDFIDRIILNFGVKPEKRFIPHITLGRFSRDKRAKIDKTIEVETEPIEIIFDSFHLMKSSLTPTGSVYETLHEFKFNT